MVDRAQERGSAVCEGPGPVAGMVAAGTDVIAVLAEGVTLGVRPPGPGRVAVLVGDREDPEVRAAAEAMRAEIFPA